MTTVIDFALADSRRRIHDACTEPGNAPVGAPYPYHQQQRQETPVNGTTMQRPTEAVKLGEKLVGRTAACRSCSSPMVWAISAKRRRIPIDPTPVEDGNVILLPIVDQAEKERLGASFRAQVVGPLDQMVEGVARFKSHFATCADADRHRKGNRR